MGDRAGVLTSQNRARVRLISRHTSASRPFAVSHIRRCAVSLSDLSYQMDRFKDLSKGIPRRLRQQLEFILEIDALKGGLRRSYLIGDHRHENSAEHSWHLAVAAMVLAEHAKERIDVSKVIRL